VRATVIGISFLAVVVLVPAGFVFGLNGGQWSWWRVASWVGALSFVFTAVAFPRDGNGSAPSRLRPLATAGLLLGLAVITISIAEMASRYSDPYGGSLLWPPALAVLAVGGLVVVELSLFAFAGRSAEPVGEHN
jgi:hypothetical protein